MLWWQYFANPPVSIIFGGMCVLLFFWSRGTRMRNGDFHAQGVVQAFLIGISFYTFLSVFLLQFFAAVPLSTSIALGYGDSRISWILAGVLADHFSRLCAIYLPSNGM